MMRRAGLFIAVMAWASLGVPLPAPGVAADSARVDSLGLHLGDSALFSRLAIRLPSTMNRLVPTRDSTGSSSTSYARGIGLRGQPPRVLAHLMTLLAGCDWVRAAGWPAPLPPSILLHWGPDEAGLDLMVSPEGTATLSRAGEGMISAQLPDSTRSDLAWCLWALDPTRVEARQAVESILLREGRIFRDRAPPDVEFLRGYTPPPPELSGRDAFDKAPEVVTAPLAAYPEMAKEAQIEGTVVLRLLVGRDGRVKDVVVMHGINYLDAAAKDAALHRIYKPALSHGEPVSVWIDVPFEFNLP